MNLWLAPHNDDECLFGSFTLLAYRPHVVVCFRSQVQQERGGPTHQEREEETACALGFLGIDSWEQSTILDTDGWADEKLYDYFVRLDAVHRPSLVWAPAIEQGGHDQHNLVGQLAVEAFGVTVQPYLTYVRGSMRSRGREVAFEPEWVSRKLRALACYESQIRVENTRPWFMDDCLREYVP